MRKNKLVTATTMVFVAAAAMLVSLAAILIINLAGAIGTMMEQAKTPHFLQMHTGELDREQLDTFANAQTIALEGYQTLEFLNIDGARIESGGETLAASVQDNGLTTQSDSFDYLLDLDGNVIRPDQGEVYIPIVYWKEGFAQVGDTLTICGHPLTVAGYLRDSQMNASLATSKRFLVSEADYEALRLQGNVEYLIEFRLVDSGMLGAFEEEYLAVGLPANGPTITWSLFRLMNALSDGLMIGVILLVSLLVLAIAFLCIRFTLLAKIEDDYREIGVMKAIGLRVWDIKNLYCAKYATMALVGCFAGYALSFVFRGALLENIRLYMGEGGKGAQSLVVGFMGALMVFVAIVTYVNVVLRRFRKISAAEALRYGISQEKKAGAKRFTLSGHTLPSVNLFMGIKDVLSRKKLYVTMLTVLVLATFILIVPQNLYNTISGDGFICYMGIGQMDFRMDIRQAGDITEKAEVVAAAMEQDEAVSQYTVLTTKSMSTRDRDGTETRLKVELGDHTTFPVEYSAGKAPVTAEEIALSAMQAEELGKAVGDSIELITIEGVRNLTVCGIYSDITNGGKTAKAAFTDDESPIMWCVVSARLYDVSLAAVKVQEYAGLFPYAKVADIKEYIGQTFGSTIKAVGAAACVAGVVALGVTLLVVLLFMKMLLTKDRYAIAVIKALGFTNKDIRVQYGVRALFVLLIGGLLGTVLAGTLGSSLAGGVIEGLGVSSFRFAVNPLVAYVLCPLAMVVVTLGATLLGTAQAGKIKLMESIKE